MQQQEVEEYVALISDLKRQSASHKPNSDPEAAYWNIQRRVAAELDLSIEVPSRENNLVSATVSDNASKIDAALATGQEEVRIAKLFATALDALREDPGFSGTDDQMLLLRSSLTVGELPKP